MSKLSGKTPRTKKHFPWHNWSYINICNQIEKDKEYMEKFREECYADFNSARDPMSKKDIIINIILFLFGLTFLGFVIYFQYN